MANRRLIEHLVYNGLLGYRQHAFWPGNGTGSYLMNLRSIFDDIMKAQEHVEIVSLDFTKTYNRAWVLSILKQLVEWGISGKLLNFIRNFPQTEP